MIKCKNALILYITAGMFPLRLLFKGKLKEKKKKIGCIFFNPGGFLLNSDENFFYIWNFC